MLPVVYQAHIHYFANDYWNGPALFGFIVSFSAAIYYLLIATNFWRFYFDICLRETLRHAETLVVDDDEDHDD